MIWWFMTSFPSRPTHHLQWAKGAATFDGRGMVLKQAASKRAAVDGYRSRSQRHGCGARPGNLSLGAPRLAERRVPEHQTCG